MAGLLLAVIYLAFVGLGLPDSLLGAAWPSMYEGFGVSIALAGVLSMTVSCCTMFSSLINDRLCLRLGTGKLTTLSVGLTMLAMFGMSFSTRFWHALLWCIPYGLGAGSVDASLNNYVALHYKSRHMSWMHCFWGLGATVSPYVVGWALTVGRGWMGGYRVVGMIQLALTAILVLSLPMWKKRVGSETAEEGKQQRALSLPEVLRIPGAKASLLSFFCYCGVEQTAALWASSFLTLQKGVDAGTAASFAALFFLGITLGRAVSGFITMKLNNTKMVFLGMGLMLVGIVCMLLPGWNGFALIGLILIGLGCAPIFPCMQHATPGRFGAERSQAIIGVQMATASLGVFVMPALFGWIAEWVSIALYPVCLLIVLALLFILVRSLPKEAER